MTIKQWFNKHVNITFTLLFAILVAFAYLMFDAMDRGEWLLTAVRFIFVIVMVGVVVRWWDEKL